MNLRWLIGIYDDPEFGLTRRERREATRLAHQKYLSGRRLALWTIPMVVGGFALMGFGYKPLADLLARFGAPWPWLLGAVIIVITVSVAAAWLYRFLYARPVRRAMRDLGYDVCVECGYRLDGLAPGARQCPECGAHREIVPPPPKNHP